MHKGIKREKNKFCEICGQACFANLDLKRHMASIHGIGKSMLTRPICNALYGKVLGNILPFKNDSTLKYIQ